MRAVSLFAGAGGEALGFHRAGFDHVACVERNADACTTLRSATGGDLFGRAHPAWGAASPGLVVQSDVAQWRPVAADIWTGGPPCQPFSSAGKGLGGADPRDGFPIVVDRFKVARAAGIAPPWLVLENVAGLTHKPHAAYLAAVLATLGDLFPCVAHKVLCCADYGVPQLRHRLIIVCGPAPFMWPEPTHAKGGAGGLLPWVTMGDALDIREGHALIGGGGNPHGKNRGHERNYRDLTDEPATTVAAVQVGNRGPWVIKRRPFSRPAPVVSASEYKGACTPNHWAMQRASDALYVETGRRRLTVPECATLQGFPVAWPFQGTKEARHRQVGNACPLPLAEALGRAVLACV